MRHSSLTGAWSGAYRYPGDVMPETVFNAQVEEDGGAFTGSVQEPNLTHPGHGAVAASEIEGTHAGQSVSFVKFYNGSGGMTHAVRYEGAVNSALTRIDGRWSIAGVWSGTFFMTRDENGEAVEAEARVEAGITRAG